MIDRCRSSLPGGRVGNSLTALRRPDYCDLFIPANRGLDSASCRGRKSSGWRRRCAFFARTPLMSTLRSRRSPLPNSPMH